jgi:hypothetical protein|nr:MAG TPA: hypothetical protein [Caudoviricetes sp.]
MKSKISSKCKKELKAIKTYLSVFHLMNLDFDGVELTTPTHILWESNERHSHSGKVTGVRYNGEHLFLVVNDNETNLPVTVSENIFASCLDTLMGVYANLYEVVGIRREEINSRNPIKSQRASRFFKEAPGFCESGGYSENDLIQTVVLAEYELTEKANTNITGLIDEIIELRKQSRDYRCPTSSSDLERCRNQNCDTCKQSYYGKLKEELLKKYLLS